MLYEDIHWADPTSLEVLDLLVERVRSIPLLVVLTHRPEFQSRWSGHGQVTALNLSKLTRAQSSAIVTRLTGGKLLPPPVLAQILAKTDDVPLYVEELTKSILEAGDLKDAGDHYDYAGNAQAFSIPASLRDSLVARLDRVPKVKEIAQIGAAIGREFSYELLAAVTPYPAAELDRALERLTDSGLVFRRGTPPTAHYTFKHALVQDAAYDSLLKTRRQSLHARIAQILEARFPATRDTEPELLAHHFTAADQFEAAIDYWQKAGELARKRLALQEAISHGNKGLELIAMLSPSAARDASELALRILLGTTWVALLGWAAPEAWPNFHAALGLAKTLGRIDSLLVIYWGLFSSKVAQGLLSDAIGWSHEMLETAEVTGDSDLLIVGHRTASVVNYWRGDLIESIAHAEKFFALYDEEKHHHLADIMNDDPKSSVGLFAGPIAWMRGYPDRAVQLAEDNAAHARRRNHPFDLGVALMLASQVWEYRREPLPLLKRIEEAEQLGRTHGLPFVSEVLVKMVSGLAALRAGQCDDAVRQLREGIEAWARNGARAWIPYLRALLGEGLALGDDVAGGLRLVEQSLSDIARPECGEHAQLAEVLRLKGWMLSLQGDTQGAELHYLESLACARQQQARSWELRTATSLARLWQTQGKAREAHALLAPIFAWFTEGFDTADLKAAAELLSESRDQR